MCFSKSNFSHTILAHNYSLSLNTYETHLNNNVILVGASGRGKSRNVIKPNIMQLNSNYIISDPKGVLIRETGTMLRKHGYKVKVLNLIDMFHSNRYNPFHYIKTDSDIYKLIEFLMENIDKSASHTDPFWPNAAKSLLASLCFYLHYEVPEEYRTFANIFRLLSLIHVPDESDYSPSEPDLLDELMGSLEEKDPEHIAVKQYSIFNSAAGRTRSSILLSAIVYLQHFALAEYENLTSSDEMEFENVTSEKTAIFVITADTDRSKNWLAGLFYSQLFDILCNQENPIHTRFILDDFICTGKIPAFDDKIAMIRSRNLSCIIVIQDEMQLECEYGKAAHTIITNCDSYVFLGSSDIDSCDIVARRLAEKKISGSYLRKIDSNKCVVIKGNQGGIFKKYNLYQHKRYRELSEVKNDKNYYDIELHHNVNSSVALNIKDILNNLYVSKDVAEVTRKYLLWDSSEEEKLYQALTKLPDITVFPHQHLRDVFKSENKATSKRLAMMHCDFILRDLAGYVLMGIEIDGNWHIEDKKQQERDSFKNDLFKDHFIPLLRISAYDIRTNLSSSMKQITEELNESSKHLSIIAPVNETSEECQCVS